MKPISIVEDCSITEIQNSDIDAYLKWLNDRDIFLNTLSIPYPYQKKDALFWLKLVQENHKKKKDPNFAIRDKNGDLIGGIGLIGMIIGSSHQAELGYWVAKPFWGRGIMTSAVREMVRLGFQQYGLIRVTAHVFIQNLGSQRVLEKNGFKLEGVLEKHYHKEDRFIDAKLYARLA